MASLTEEAQQLILRDQLGSPLKIFAPHTVGNFVGGVFVLAFSMFFTWFALSVFPSPLLPTNYSLFGVVLHASTNYALIHGDSWLMTMLLTFSIVFLIFGILFFLLGIRTIASAIYNRYMRAVICIHGVAYIQPSGADSFRWQDVLTTFHKVNVSITYNQTTHIPRTRVSHTYAVHCNDDREFVFKSPLARVQDLREIIEVQVARMKQSIGQSSSYENE